MLTIHDTDDYSFAEPVPFCREYVRTGEWANELTQLATCYVEHMAKAIEFAHYSGDGETDRYYTLIDGLMTEVTFRYIDRECDEDDWLYYKYGVFAPGIPEPIETFTVRIDGRA